ncbi:MULTISPECIES: hypothetical protein [Pseudomonas]|uniref:hypothetical protein n=1 Tax=Pseudomonas TaxID=286 RepID=UPI0015E092BA|nr:MULTISPECIES: hypothetical protein [Pseudomonas]MBS7562635.1 hypothetical protein [Pseudomonas sp. RC4D1]MCY7259758.1 hypothetical protein [Pseudomonas protegens]
MPRDRHGPGKGPQQVFLGGVPFDTGTTSRCGARFGPVASVDIACLASQAS